MKNIDHLLLKVIRGEKIHRPPVWLMRQAGRILPQYRAIRNSLSGFKELVENPSLAAEVTIQPVDILGVDAAIIFSDILVVPQAMGLEYLMVEKRGPYFPNTVSTQKDVDSLHIATAQEIQYTLDAISIVKKNLNGKVPIIGFAGAPWTIFAYMIEGGGSKTFSKARRILYSNPQLSHRLLEKITTSTVNYLRGQINAGADLIQLFDSWAGVLPPDLYEKFGLKYIQQICNQINDVPKTVFAKDAYFARESFGRLDCDVVGLDWCMDIKTSRKLIGEKKVLQGNLDPCILYGSDEQIISETEKMLSLFGSSRHIANLGHGVYPDTDFNKVKLFVDTVKNWRY